MPQKPLPRHLDLFSGIGGFALAAGWAGFETIAFAETDAYCSKILKRHWPHVRNHGDVRGIDGYQFRDIALVTAGFPCQPFSCAGARRGDRDERFLWPELARLLGEVQPRFALLENVPALLSIDGGRTFNRILSDLAALGFDAIWNCVPASAVGALHRRDRIWIVCCNAHAWALQSVVRQNGNLAAIGDMADSVNQRQLQQGRISREIGRRPVNGSPQMADAAITRVQNGRGTSIIQSRPLQEFERRCSDVADADRSRLAVGFQSENGYRNLWEEGKAIASGRIWRTEPDVGRVANGVPKRVDRLKGLGNAIVPQVAYVFLKAIYDATEAAA